MSDELTEAESAALNVDIGTILKQGRESMQKSIDDNSRAPISPVECSYIEVGGSFVPRGRQTGNTTGYETGLTKREYFAALAMQGCCAFDPEGNNSFSIIAKYAVQVADALLVELEMSTPKQIEPDELENI